MLCSVHQAHCSRVAVHARSSGVCAGSLGLVAQQVGKCGNDTGCISQQAAAVFRPCLRCLMASGQSPESCFIGEALPFNISGVSHVKQVSWSRTALALRFPVCGCGITRGGGKP